MIYQWADHQLFKTAEGTILFGVDQGTLFLIDEQAEEAISQWASGEVLSLEEVSPRHKETLEQLVDAGVLVPAGSRKPPVDARCGSAGAPLSTMVLEVAQDCNLNCRYCYAEGGAYGKKAQLLPPETARKAVGYLFDHSGRQEMISLILFGGEPLLNMEAIRAAIDEVHSREQKTGQKVLIALTTNGTLLDSETIDYLHHHRVSVSVSLDGPPDLHDRNRPDRAGGGSYRSIVPHLQQLIAGSPRPVGARVTLTPDQWHRGEEVFDHLIGLGFHEVGIAPASPVTVALLPDADQEERLFQSFAALSRRFVAHFRQRKILAFTNLIDLLARLHVGQVKGISCGAGFGYLAVDAEGSLFLCHRLVGEASFEVGNLDAGSDRFKIHSALDTVTAGVKTICVECWARTLCAGGCHYENHLREKHLGLAPGTSCSFIRRWLQLGIEVYAELRETSESNFLRMLEKRARC